MQIQIDAEAMDAMIKVEIEKAMGPLMMRVAELEEIEISDRERGEIIKRAMMALDHAGVPNIVEVQPGMFSTNAEDPLEMLAHRIRWLAAKVR